MPLSNKMPLSKVANEGGGKEQKQGRMEEERESEYTHGRMEKDRQCVCEQGGIKRAGESVCVCV